MEIADILKRFGAGLAEEVVVPHRTYNIPPSSYVWVVYQDEKGKRKLRQMVWDLRKSWTKEKEEGAKTPPPKGKDKKPKKGPLSNLTATTALKTPFFKSILETTRCLVVVDGFNEWKGKLPFRFVRRNGDQLGLGGVYRTKVLPDGKKEYYAAVMTTFPNALIRQVHTRQPIILPPEQEGLWLNPGSKLKNFEDYLGPSSPSELEYYPVSKEINKTYIKVDGKYKAIDSPELILPVGKVVALAA